MLLALAAACRRDAGSGADAAPPVADRSAVLVIIPDHVHPTPRPLAVAGLHAPLAPRGETLVVASRGGGAAVEIETERGASVIHNGRTGNTYAAIGDVALSADGAHVAYGAVVDGRWHMVRDGVEGEPFDAVDAPVFSPDGAHLAYEALSGPCWYLVVDGDARFRSPTRFLAHAFSGDSSRIVFLEDLDPPALARLLVSDLALERPVVVATDVDGLVLDERGTRAATVRTVEGGAQVVLTVRLDAPDQVTTGARYRDVRDPVFGPGGELAYLAERDGERIAVLDGAEAPFPPGSPRSGLVVRGGGRGLGALVASGGATRLHRLFVGGRSTPDVGYDDAADLTFDPSGRHHAFAAARGGRWFVVVDGAEGPPFDRVVTPRFSPDGRRVVYRARQDGRRFAVTADLKARTTRRHPSYDQVFPLTFSGGNVVASGVVDGAQVMWKAEPL